MVFTTQTNLALRLMAHKIIPLLTFLRKLIILSGPVKNEYGFYFEPYAESLMLDSAEEINLEIQTRVESELAGGNDRSHQKKITRYIINCMIEHDWHNKVPFKFSEDLSKDLLR